MNNGLDFGHAAGWFGPELVSGKTLSDSLPGTKIALIKYAVGSTYLATHWRPPSPGGDRQPPFGLVDTKDFATDKSHYRAVQAAPGEGIPPEALLRQFLEQYVFGLKGLAFRLQGDAPDRDRLVLVHGSAHRQDWDGPIGKLINAP